VGARSACIARSFSVCVVSAPFSVEGGSRKERAGTQLDVLRQHADCVLVIPNDVILAEAPSIPINRAFRVMNSVIASPVNMMLRSLGKEDMGLVQKQLGAGRILAMDSAEWDRENAEFAVIESLQKSKWLDIKNKKPKSAILFVEGSSVYDDLVELGTSFSRILGEDSRVLVASPGERKSGLSVTAVVGY
jgi:cell division protein FtsZ